MRCLVKHSPGLLGVASIIIPISERRNLSLREGSHLLHGARLGLPSTAVGLNV